MYRELWVPEYNRHCIESFYFKDIEYVKRYIVTSISISTNIAIWTLVLLQQIGVLDAKLQFLH